MRTTVDSPLFVRFLPPGPSRASWTALVPPYTVAHISVPWDDVEDAYESVTPSDPFARFAGQGTYGA